MQDEMKQQERQQIQERQEKMNLEDIMVRHIQRQGTQNTTNKHSDKVPHYATT